MSPNIVAALVVVIIGLGAVSFVAIGGRAQAAIPAGERTFYVTGVEYKGATSTKDLAAPEVDPTSLGAGYRYKRPGDADKSDASRWEVSSYRWEPGAMQVLQGDKVALVGFIVNGDKHRTQVLDPTGRPVVAQQVWERGREYRISFVADQTGYYTLHCQDHHPSMTASILVLPR